MRRRHVPILVLILAVSLPIAASAVGGTRENAPELSQTPVTLTAVADATVRAWAPDTNFGDEASLEISYGGPSEEAVTLVRFDLSGLPPDAVVDSASLGLYLESASGTDPVSIAAYAVTSTWEESGETGVTWNTFPTVAEIGINASIDGVAGSYKTWSATSFAQSWIDAPSSNYGVMLRGPYDGTVNYERWFQSRESMEMVPQLEVTYHLPSYTFTGHVYEGEPEDTSTPLEGVTVELWGDEDEWPEGGAERVLLASDLPTGSDGAFLLEWDRASAWPYLYVIETDPADAYSTGADADPPGSVTNYNFITYRYDDLLETGLHDFGGIAFWDRFPEELPDLIVTDVWPEGAHICLQVQNVGAAVAPAGHQTALSVDGDQQSTLTVGVDLAPGERWGGCFDFTWVCTEESDTVQIDADVGDDVRESDETNNAAEEVWNCDRTAPEILSGPTVSGITENSAVFSWETDEVADSVVRYDALARVYGFEETDPASTVNHQVTLEGLTPSVTYHYVAVSTDPTGNAVESGDLIFETLAAPDTRDPTVHLVVPPVISDTVILSADADDDTGVEKVEFYLDDQLLFTDYTAPYEHLLDSRAYGNGDHLVTAKAYDLSSKTGEETQYVDMRNLRDATGPNVTITAPVDSATVSGTVQVKADLSDDVGLHHAQFFVTAPEPEGEPVPDYAGWRHWPKDSAPKQATVTFEWDARGLEHPEHYSLAVRALDTTFKGAEDVIRVYVEPYVEPGPPPQADLKVVDHRVIRNDNRFTILLKVKNEGDAAAENVRVVDGLRGFQVIEEGHYSSSTQYDVRSDWQFSGSHALARIHDHVSIPATKEHIYTYDAVPVLVHLNAPTPQVGFFIDLSWDSATTGRISKTEHLPVLRDTDGVPIPDSHALGTRFADYLIVTHPFRLLARNPGNRDDVNGLLSNMARLAKLKKGVLGYLFVADPEQTKNDLIDLITPSFWSWSTTWADRLHPDFAMTLKGYLLIVGESDIVPSFDLAEITHSDHPYSARPGTTGSGVPEPELIVGRIVGNTALSLTKPIRTSIGIAEHAKGYSLDHSDAFVVSGNGKAYNNLRRYATESKKLLDPEFATNILHCSDYFPITTFSSGYSPSDGLAVGDVWVTTGQEILIADHTTGVIDMYDGQGNYVGSQLSNFREGDGFASGDVLGGAKSEIIIIKDASDQAYVYDMQMNEQSHFPVPWDGQYDEVLLGNVTGDSKLEILVARDGGAWWVSKRILAYDGSGQQVDDIAIPTHSPDDLAASDFVGDGYDDILIADAALDLLHVYNTESGQWQQHTMAFDADDRFAAANVFYGAPAELFFFRHGSKTIDFFSYHAKEDKLEMDFWVEGGYARGDEVVLRATSGDAQAQYVVASPTGSVRISDFNCKSRWLGDFKNSIRDSDLVYFHAHGRPQGSAIESSQFKDMDFGDANPMLIANSCSTGDYEAKNAISEAFFHEGGSVFIGPTINAPMSGNKNLILEHWVNTDHTIGQAFVMHERELTAINKKQRSVLMFNLYGDPRLGAVSPSSATVASDRATEGATVSIDVVVPDYDVSSDALYDHVDIPGGMAIDEHGMPDVPFYVRTVDYPEGYQIQEVELVERSGLETATGLRLPYVDLIYDGEDPDPEQLAQMTWYPDQAFEWHTVEDADGTTLYILLYPFYYNHHTTDVEFYKTYNFEIDYTVPDVNLKSLATDKDAYEQGERVTIGIGLENTDESQPAVVSTVVNDYVSGEVVAGLPLRTLSSFAGVGSFSASWDTTGYPPGYYSVEATAMDPDGSILDRRVEMFRLGIASIDVTALTATPMVFTVGDQVDISMTFENTGTVPIDGTAVMQVLAWSGEIVQEFRDDIANLEPTDDISIEQSWDTSSAAMGSYRILAYVTYDGKATKPLILRVGTAAPVYLPIVLSQ